jgi:hypothetical protein
MERYKERESTFSGTDSNLTVSGDEMQDPTNLPNGFSTFFKAVTKNGTFKNREKR